jgi:hypothetical protein
VAEQLRRRDAIDRIAPLQVEVLPPLHLNSFFFFVFVFLFVFVLETLQSVQTSLPFPCFFSTPLDVVLAPHPLNAVLSALRCNGVQT